jgi:hypothetical protein
LSIYLRKDETQFAAMHQAPGGPCVLLPFAQRVALLILCPLEFINSKLWSASPLLEALFGASAEKMSEHDAGRRVLSPTRATRLAGALGWSSKAGLRRVKFNVQEAEHVSRRCERATAPCSAGAASVAERVLRTNAATFSGALLGEDDVDVLEFMRGCREFCDTILVRLGSFSRPAAKQVTDNLAKIEATYALNPRRFGSMHALLEEEARSQMHARMRTRGLADPSAAMGLLWARRGLQYWICLFRPLLEAGLDGRTARLPNHEDAKAAHGESLGPYTG